MTEQLVNLKLIDDNPYQDRGSYEDIAELGRTIAVNGLEQKPKARPIGNRYQLKFGHRRKRAFEWLRDNFKKESLPDQYSGYTVMPLVVEEITDKEMFEGVVIENVHRDDLKVTEKARLLRRYKEVNSEATSEQIGLVFNMNAATVRGMDIFLDLPVAAQAKLDDGTISMSTARALHSMQKIAPEAKIIETLKAIEKGDALPEEVIEHKIDRLDNVVDMWNDHNHDGKARAGYHGWPLDMKNFPNKLLPEPSRAEIAGAFSKEDEKQISDELTRAFSGYQVSLEEALVFLKVNVHVPPGVGEKIIQMVEHLVNPPACTVCPFYTKVRGSHYCGVKICHARKSIAWSDYMVESASKNTRITIYSETDGAFRVLSYEDKRLVEKKHKGLRLIPKRTINGYAYQDFKGLDDDLVVVVATGEALNQMSRSTGRGSTHGGKKTEKEKAEMRALRLYRVKRKELLWAFTACAKSIFDAVPGVVLERLSNWHFMGIDQRPPVEKPSEKDKDAFGEYLRRLMVWEMIEDRSSSFEREKLTGILDNLEKYSRDWKVKIPTSLRKMAEQFDAEIKSVSTETKAVKK